MVGVLGMSESALSRPSEWRGRARGGGGGGLCLLQGLTSSRFLKLATSSLRRSAMTHLFLRWSAMSLKAIRAWHSGQLSWRRLHEYSWWSNSSRRGTVAPQPSSQGTNAMCSCCFATMRSRCTLTCDRARHPQAKGGRE